jgi:transcriptional regulator with XRE-family HTH domain
MEKSPFTPEYRVVLSLLREIRGSAKVTQLELAKRVEETQSYISKLERGEVRLDLIQLRTICQALGTNLPSFVTLLEERLEKKQRRK